jgi:hypothetical protein
VERKLGEGFERGQSLNLRSKRLALAFIGKPASATSHEQKYLSTKYIAILKEVNL